jgi:hypothetical protein
MGERAREFLEHWKSEHVESIPDARRLRAAVHLVASCRQDATRAGIPAHELRAAAQNDMIREMLSALAATSSRDGTTHQPLRQDLPSSSRSLAIFAAIRRASSLVSSFAAERQPGSSAK